MDQRHLSKTMYTMKEGKQLSHTLYTIEKENEQQTRQQDRLNN